MAYISPLTKYTQTLFKSTGLNDRDRSSCIERDKGEGYEQNVELDLDSNGIITPQEVWARYYADPDLARRASPALVSEGFLDPFKLTDDIASFTHKVIANCGTDEEKARAILDAILGEGVINEGTPEETERLNVKYDADDAKRPAGLRTPEQVIQERSAQCVEFSFLFTAMARAAGLEAGIVNVKTDDEGREVKHACASMNLNGKHVLVDPAYGIYDIQSGFDIKHRAVSELSDVEALGLLKSCSAIIHINRSVTGVGGDVEKELSDAEENITLSNEAVGKNVNCADHSLIGDAYFAKKNWVEAAKMYELALHKDPNNKEAYYALGLTYELLGDMNSAAIVYERLVVSFPEDYKAHMQLAAIFEKLGNKKMAIKEYEASLKIKPDIALACLRLGQIFKRLGHPFKAAEMFKQVYRLDPLLAPDHEPVVVAAKARDRFEDSKILISMKTR
jgi:hypothetical protein